MSITNEHIYIDLLCTNATQTNTNHRVAVKFMQNQSKQLLKSTDGYKLSIIRFSLNTETLPVFIPSMQSITQTTYSVTMEANGVRYQQFMEFIPQNVNPIDSDEYYYVYNYEYLIYLVNKCMTSCFNNLKNVTNINSYALAPIMSFDKQTQNIIKIWL